MFLDASLGWRTNTKELGVLGIHVRFTLNELTGRLLEPLRALAHC